MLYGGLFNYMEQGKDGLLIFSLYFCITGLGNNTKKG
jgi:hypothetical protein